METKGISKNIKFAIRKAELEFTKIISISEEEDKITYNNNDLLLNLKFKLRDFRSKLLKLEYGNIKFRTFDKFETNKTFNALKKINPKFNNLKIVFIKKDIIQIKLS